MSKSSRDPYSVGYITCTILPHNMTDQVFAPYSAFFLKRLDERMERSGLFYVRFMDDILVLSPDPLAAPEGGQGGQRGTWLARPANTKDQ